MGSIHVIFFVRFNLYYCLQRKLGVCLLVSDALISELYLVLEPLLLSVRQSFSLVVYFDPVPVVTLACVPMHSPMDNLGFNGIQKLHLVFHAHRLHL